MARTYSGWGQAAPATTPTPRARDETKLEEAENKPNPVMARLEPLRKSLQKHAWFRVLESTVEGFLKDKVPEQAAAMTYYGIFALFPLILVFIAAAGFALQSNEAARDQIMGVITGLLPQGQEQIQKVIGSVIQAKGTAAGIGVLMLLWSALGWFTILDEHINGIWGVKKPRSFLKSKLFALAMVAAMGGVGLLSFGATAAIKFLADFTHTIAGSQVVWQLAVSGLSILTIAIVFLLLYRFTPQRDIQMSDVWPAALTIAVVWELTRRVLAVYLEKTDMISGYGPIGAAMALLFWLYVACIIIMVGAELSYAIAKERRHIDPEEELKVVAPPGEQPTPKFAPQTGQGFHAAKDEPEPTHKENTGPPPTGHAQPPPKERSAVQDRQPVASGATRGQHHGGIVDTVRGLVLAAALLGVRRVGAGRRAARAR